MDLNSKENARKLQDEANKASKKSVNSKKNQTFLGSLKKILKNIGTSTQKVLSSMDEKNNPALKKFNEELKKLKI